MENQQTPRDFNNRDQFLERPLPSNTEAERAILGAILLDSNLLAEVSEAPNQLEITDFYSPFHRSIFEAMRELLDAGQQIDPILIGEILKTEGKLASSGGVAAVANLTYGLPHFTSISHYAKLVKEKAVARTAIRLANALVSELLNEEDSPVVPISAALDNFYALCDTGQAGRKPTATIRQALPEQAERWRKMQSGEIVTISTGIPQIDEKLTGSGLEKRMFHVVGARPGCGKTSLALDIAGFNAAQGKSVLFFSAELSREVILDRLLSPFAAVPRRNIAPPFTDYDGITIGLSDRVFERLTSAGEQLSDYRLYVNDRARTPAEVRAACRAVARENNHGIDLIILDYLQRFRFPANARNQHDGVTMLLKEFSELAPECGAAVIALSQLSRDAERRADSKPRMDDFRESGSIEEYARTAMILHSPDDGKPHRVVKVSLVKQGEGETFDAELIYYTPFMTFGGREPLYSEL